jgi:hypothetical protein
MKAKASEFRLLLFLPVNFDISRQLIIIEALIILGVNPVKSA